MRRNVAVGKHQRDSIGVIHASDLSNEAVVAAYLNALRAQKRSQHTVDHRRELLTRVGDFIHPTTLSLATFEELLDWQTSIATLDAGTVAGYVSNVRVFYRWLVRPMRILGVSPAEDLVIPRVPARQPRPMPEADFQWTVRSCGDPLMTVWLYLARYAGLRCCEIAILRRDDVRDETDGTHRLHIIGKGRKERFVPISAELREELAPWMRSQGYLWVRVDGKPFRSRNVVDRFSDFFHSINMPYTAHQLRHLYGTDALERSRDIRLVQESMGHASVATTQLYTQVNSRNGVALAAELGADLRKLRRR